MVGVREEEENSGKKKPGGVEEDGFFPPPVQPFFFARIIFLLLILNLFDLLSIFKSANVSFYNNFLLSVEDSTPAVESVLSTFYQITQYPISLLNSVFKKDRDQTLNLTG